ncbi:uncharacterized protein ATC70_013246 [Mucor velutinosus]|uniref:Uncharacterized protein n=1 Tax=Mucor velutinosus TaxID=708070 RepID=A0AAN7D7M3_9FUNG|nr:hypothetical protein ATC70_013246 [Mucor velutinosus]
MQWGICTRFDTRTAQITQEEAPPHSKEGLGGYTDDASEYPALECPNNISQTPK